MPKDYLSSWERRRLSPFIGWHLPTSNSRGFAPIRESLILLCVVFRVKVCALIVHNTINKSVNPLVKKFWINYWIAVLISPSTSLLTHSLLASFVNVIAFNLLRIDLTSLKFHYHSPYTNTYLFISFILAISFTKIRKKKYIKQKNSKSWKLGFNH